MAKLPSALLKKHKRTLADLEVSETVYVMPTCLRIDDQHECYLDPEEEFQDQPSDIHALQVTRAVDGYHVIVRGDRSICEWEPWGSRLPDVRVEFPREKLLQVATIKDETRRRKD